MMNGKTPVLLLPAPICDWLAGEPKRQNSYSLRLSRCCLIVVIAAMVSVSPELEAQISTPPKANNLADQGNAGSTAARTWTDVNGRTLQAQFVKVEGENVVLQQPETLLRIPLSRFSETDREWVKQRVGEAPGDESSDTKSQPGVPTRSSDLFILESNSGATVEAKVVSFSTDRVKIRRSDGMVFQLPLSSLSPATMEKVNVCRGQIQKRDEKLNLLLAELGQVMEYQGSMPSVDVAFEMAQKGFTLMSSRGQPVSDVPKESARVSASYKGVILNVGTSKALSKQRIHDVLGNPDRIDSSKVTFQGTPGPELNNWYVYGWCWFGFLPGSDTASYLRVECDDAR